MIRWSDRHLHRILMSWIGGGNVCSAINDTTRLNLVKSHIDAGTESAEQRRPNNLIGSQQDFSKALLLFEVSLKFLLLFARSHSNI